MSGLPFQIFHRPDGVIYGYAGRCRRLVFQSVLLEQKLIRDTESTKRSSSTKNVSAAGTIPVWPDLLTSVPTAFGVHLDHGKHTTDKISPGRAVEVVL